MTIRSFNLPEPWFLHLHNREDEIRLLRVVTVLAVRKSSHSMDKVSHLWIIVNDS